MPTAPLFTLNLRTPLGPLDYDLNLLAVSVQGLANRLGPRVMVEHPIIGDQVDDMMGTWHWLERFRQPGQWLAEREVIELTDVADLIRHVGVHGLAIFDPEVPASSNAAAMMSGRRPKNLMPWLPISAISLTHRRASSGVAMGPSQPLPKAGEGSSRGAVISLRFDRRWCSSIHPMPLPEPGSALVVMPCAIHSFRTYSAGTPCAVPPRWPCKSTNPGMT